MATFNRHLFYSHESLGRFIWRWEGKVENGVLMTEKKTNQTVLWKNASTFGAGFCLNMLIHVSFAFGPDPICNICTRKVTASRKLSCFHNPPSVLQKGMTREQRQWRPNKNNQTLLLSWRCQALLTVSTKGVWEKSIWVRAEVNG